ncbi:hypothetical protein BGZ97_010490, partial [Linnemannia gamsii]
MLPGPRDDPRFLTVSTAVQDKPRTETETEIVKAQGNGEVKEVDDVKDKQQQQQQQEQQPVDGQ